VIAPDTVDRPLMARPLMIAATALAVAAAAAGCSGAGNAQAKTSPTPPATAAAALPPAAQLAGRAVLGQDQYYAATYRFTPSDGSPAGTALVARTRAGVRLDLVQPADATRVARTTVVVQNRAGTVFCRLTSAARACLPAGARPPADADPRLHHAFTDWLDKLADPAAALSVTVAAAPRGATGTCYSVEGVAASLDPPVDPGLYCFDNVGRITALRVAAGLLTVSAVTTPPPDVTVPAPVGGALPGTAAPSPTPPPTPSASPSNTPPKGISTPSSR
jgi:hypothetical protein